MTLIDPFRRHIVYPAIIKNLERAWTSACGCDEKPNEDTTRSC
jgi:hypothetical protein